MYVCTYVYYTLYIHLYIYMYVMMAHVNVHVYMVYMYICKQLYNHYDNCNVYFEGNRDKSYTCLNKWRSTQCTWEQLSLYYSHTFEHTCIYIYSTIHYYTHTTQEGLP